MKNLSVTLLFIFILNKLPAQWAQIYQDPSAGYFFDDVKFPSPAIGYVCGTGEIRKTSNAGLTWSSQYSNPSNSIQGLFFLNSDTGFAVGGTYMGASEIIMKTTDGGSNWSVISTGNFHPLYSVNFPNDTTGYAVGIGGTIVKTTDGGITWNQQLIGSTTFMTRVTFLNTDTGYATGYNGCLLKTMDGGSHWSALTTGTTENLLGIYFVDDTTGYACGGIYGTSSVLIKTTDGGMTWIPITLPANIINLHSLTFYDLYTGYVVGDDGSILRTGDAGATWLQEYSPTSDRLFTICYADQNTVFAVGENRRIVKRSNAMMGVETNLPDENTLVYPNPFTSSIKIKEAKDNASVKIYNLLGKLIFTKDKYENDTEIDLSTLAPGIYFVETAGRKIKIVKE